MDRMSINEINQCEDKEDKNILLSDLLTFLNIVVYSGIHSESIPVMELNDIFKILEISYQEGFEHGIKITKAMYESYRNK